MKWLYTALVIVAPLLMGATVTPKISPTVSTTVSGKESSTALVKEPSTALTKQLRYVDTPYGWPFSFQNGQQLIGTFPRLMTLIAEDLQLQVSMLMAPDVRTLEQINKQHADVTTIVTYQSPVGNNLNVENYPDFVHICAAPLITGTMALISINSIPEMEGTKPSLPKNLAIGVLRLSNTGSFLDEPFNSPHKLFQFNSTALMLKSFIAGRIDAFIGDPVINISWANHLANKNLAAIEYPIGNYQIFLAITKDWTSNNVEIEDLCAAITRYRKSGIIDEIQAAVIKASPPSL
jgi:hypothetical protein